MIEEDLAVGVHVRHRKQPAWGIGVVTSIRRSDAHVDVSVAFADGEKKLRLTADVFDWVDDDELAALAAAAAKAARAAKPKAPKATTLTPTTTVTTQQHHHLAAVPGDRVLVVTGNSVDFYDGKGAAGGSWSVAVYVEDVVVAGDLVVGRSRGPQWLVGDVATNRGRAAPQPVDGWFGHAAAGPRPGTFLAHATTDVVLVDESGAAHPVPLQVPPLHHLDGVGALGDGVLVSSFANDGPEAERRLVRCVGVDGVERWRRAAGGFALVGDRAALFVDHDRTVFVDVDGAVVGEAPWCPGYSVKEKWPVVVVGADLVFAARDAVVRVGNDGVVRWATPLPVWSGCPAVAGNVVACRGGDGGRSVFFVDAGSGAHLSTVQSPQDIEALCAVQGTDAVVARSWSKKLTGWRHIAQAPERLFLPHADKVYAVVSFAPGVLVASAGDDLVFWSL